jgi:uncharacterized protein YjiS (DUF1127 family)
MSRIILGVMTIRPRHASRWGYLKHRLVEWRRRSMSRQELMGLGEGGLHDLGLSRCDVECEASKPFWSA